MKHTLRPVQQLAGGFQRQQHVPLLTERQAAERCCYFERGCQDPVRSFRVWARRAGVPVKVIAGRRHYDPRVLEAFIDRAAWTVRHRVKRSA